MTKMPDFSTEKERQQWIIDNADYFSLILRRDGKNNRAEFPTLADAENGALRLLELDPTARFLIYAVSGVSDVYVKTVSK